MLKKSLTLIICCFSFSAQSSDSQIMPGQKLHDDANCMRCHAKLGYNTHHTTKMQIHSIADLKKAVSFCNTNLNTGWFDDEINEVAAYLNKTYYKMPK